MGLSKGNRITQVSAYFFCILVVITSGIATAEPMTGETVDAQIKTCNSLEDDKPKQAIELAETLLKTMSKSQGRINYGHILGCLAWSYAVDNQVDKAQLTASDLEMLASKLEASEDKIKLLRRVGSIFHRTGNRIAAVDNYKAAMGLAEILNLKQQQIPLLVNLGVLNSQLREHAVAIDDYYLALDLINETESFNYQAPVLFNLAVTLNGQRRFQESLKIYHQVEAMITEQWPDSRVAQVYTGLAAANLGVEQITQAKSYIDKALILLQKDGNKSVDLYGAKIIYAEILTKQGMVEEAKLEAGQAWTYFKSPEHREQLLSINNPLYSLAELYEQNGDSALSLEIHKLARNINQEFQDSFNKETMVQMQARLSDSVQRNELTELKNQNVLNELRLNKANHYKERQMIIFGFGLLVFIGYLYWQKRINKHLREVSMKDSLTKLGNRRAITDWIEHHKFPQNGKVRLMWLIDLDLFKRINDEFGHETGDRVLIEVSNKLLDFSGADRFVGRWGGEEFMMLSDDVAVEDVQDFGNKLLMGIELLRLNCQGKELNLTASMGVCQIVDSKKSSWNEALSLADKALYLAKDQGRNTLVHLKPNKQDMNQG